MKKIIISLVFLVLMPLAISRALGDSLIPPVNGDIVIKTADPSTIPKPQGTSGGVGIPYTNNISPDRTYLQIYYALPNTHYQTADIADLNCQNTGHYDIVLDFYLTNPSYKWACAVALPIPSADPYNCVEGYEIDATYTVPSNSYLGNLWSNITWSAQNVWVWRVELKFTVVSTPALIKIFLYFNQMWTDLNSDGEVNIKDIYIVARHYNTIYQNGQSNLDPWNVVIDNVVGLTDIAAVAHEFGRTIPP